MSNHAEQQNALRRILVATAGMLAMLAAVGRAGEIRTDFNDLSGGVLAGQYGGAGMADAEAWGNSDTLLVIDGDLSAPPATQFGLTQAGAARSVQGTSGAAVQSTRGLANPLGGVVWFSLLIQQPDSASRAGLSFNADSTSSAIVPRVVAAGASLFIDYGDDEDDVWVGNAVPIGQPVLIVGRIELDLIDESLDRLSVWIDPDVTVPGPPDAVVDSTDAFGSTIDRIGLISYHWSGTIGGIVDLVTVANGPTAYTAVTGVAGGDWLPTFADEFELSGLDLATWELDDERYNVEVSDGLLRLVTTQVDDGYLTGRIASYFTQRFGYFEARYRIGADTGLNNAFWLSTPAELVREANGKPQYVDRTEVDIQETHYPHKLSMTLHDWAPVHDPIQHEIAYVGGNLAEETHTYAFEWRTDNRMIWYFDGAPQMVIPLAEVNRARTGLPLAVLFSTLVATFAGPPGPNLDGTSMDVEYVRVYQAPGWSGAVDGDWGDPANWGRTGVPGVDGAAVFNRPTAQSTVALPADVSLREVYIEGANTPGITLAPGGRVMYLGDVSSSEGIASVTLNTDVHGIHTFAVDVVGIRDLVLGNYSRAGATLRFAGGVDSLAPGRILHLGGGAIELLDAIGGNIGDVVIFARAHVLLASANAFSGETDIRGGVLTVSTNGALGVASADAPTTVADGATLAFANGVHYTEPEPLYIAGAGDPGESGAVQVADASAVTWSNPIWLNDDAVISSGVNGGTLTIGGAVNSPSGGTHELTLAGNGHVVLAGMLGTRISNLNKVDAGRATLSANNFYGGITTIAEGTLALTGNGSTGQSNAVHVASNGVFDVSMRSSTYTVAANRTLDVGGRVIGDVTIASDGLLSGAGAVEGGVLVEAGGLLQPAAGSGPGMTIDGSLALSADAEITTSLGVVLHVAGANLSGPASGAVTWTITDADIAPGVYPLMDWRGVLSGGIDPADIDLQAADADATLTVSGKRLWLVRLTPEQRYDFDASGAVDEADLVRLLAVFSGPDGPLPGDDLVADFVRADHDADGDVDLADFAEFQRRFTGP